MDLLLFIVLTWRLIGCYRPHMDSTIIVSYRLSGRSKFIVPWAIANATYRKLSYRDLSCHYLIVSYPELPGHEGGLEKGGWE